MIPYVNNEHISNIYRIYGSNNNLKQSPVKYKYNVDKKNPSNYIKNIEKYYDYYNVYLPKKNSVDSYSNPSNKINVVPNRKLSPLKRGLINI